MWMCFFFKKKDSVETTLQYLWKWGIHDAVGKKDVEQRISDREVLVVVICRWNITVPEGSTRFHLNAVCILLPSRCASINILYIYIIIWYVLTGVINSLKFLIYLYTFFVLVLYYFRGEPLKNKGEFDKWVYFYPLDIDGWENRK